jgi:hypothetical protein
LLRALLQNCRSFATGTGQKYKFFSIISIASKRLI